MNILYANILDKSAYWERKILLCKIIGGGGVCAPVPPVPTPMLLESECPLENRMLRYLKSIICLYDCQYLVNGFRIMKGVSLFFQVRVRNGRVKCRKSNYQKGGGVIFCILNWFHGIIIQSVQSFETIDKVIGIWQT